MVTKKYFVTGIDTDSGKTLVSAILCEALKADYWKPVQCGLPKDSDRLRELVTWDNFRVFPEIWFLEQASSPHAAARAESVEIKLSDFIVPPTNNSLIIEGAGGVLVPLNDENFIIDLISQIGAKVILVADLYLGSINHTLLTIEALRARELEIHGIVFSGDANFESERIILKYSKLKKLLHIKREEEINKEVILRYAHELGGKL